MATKIRETSKQENGCLAIVIELGKCNGEEGKNKGKVLLNEGGAMEDKTNSMGKAGDSLEPTQPGRVVHFRQSYC
jgi:hypothetical protein